MCFWGAKAKEEHEASSKKRKTEWQAGLANLPGDVTLVKDWVHIIFEKTLAKKNT